ncbi:MAG: ATP-binding cassette domain-containing protein [Deltaproteobacteria bacterium]|nr:ATP-binding cassette domain-containing protein [Deltaproteobacteria bacterium]
MAELKLKNIRVIRQRFELNVPSLSAHSGKILGVMGKSGCGKSTLLQVIAGFEKNMEGEIFLDEKEMTYIPAENRKMALVFQRPALFSQLTVLENVCFGLKIQHLSKNEQIARSLFWLRRLGLEHLKDFLPHQISGGEAQRVALARSVVVNFPILLLDEPFSALDSQSRAESRKAVRDVVSEMGLIGVLVSHDLDDIKSVADDYCIMDSGRIIKFETVKH